MADLLAVIDSLLSAPASCHRIDKYSLYDEHFEVFIKVLILAGLEPAIP